MLVQRTRLLAVFEPSGELCNAVRELVCDHVECLRELADLKDLVAAIAEDHLGAIPERVLEAHAEVDGRDQLHSFVVDAVTSPNVAIEVVSLARVLENVVDRLIARGRVALAALAGARKLGTSAMRHVVDGLALADRRPDRRE